MNVHPALRLPLLAIALLPLLAGQVSAQSDEEVARQIRRAEEKSDYSRTVLITSVDRDGSLDLQMGRFPSADSPPTALPVELLAEIAGCPARPSAATSAEWAIASCSNLASVHRADGTILIQLAPLHRLFGQEDESVMLEVFVPEGLSLECPEGFSQSAPHRCMADVALSESGAAPFTFRYSYRGASGLQLVFVLGGIFLATPLITAWLCWSAMRAKASDTEGVWFSLVRILRWSFLIPFVIWVGAVDSLSPLHWLAVFGPERFALDLNTLKWPTLLLSWAPPLFSWFLCMLVSYPAMRALRRIRLNLSQWVGQAFFFMAAIWIPLALFLQGFLQFFLDARWAIAWFIAAILMRAVAGPALLRISGMQPEAITQGPLRDRAFALAERMGVKLRNLYFLPTERMPMANACAHQARMIYLTDYLLEKLNRAEVDAVIAHELGHLKRKHALKRVAAYLFLLAAMAAVSPFLMEHLHLPEFTQAMVIIFPPLVGLLAFSRRHEYQADSEAAAATGQPESVVTGLAKLTRLNSMPMRWGRWDELLMTHPATIRRARAVLEAAGIPAERMQTLLAAAAEKTNGGDHYPIPTSGTTRLFSTRYRTRAAQLASWSTTLSAVLFPALVAFAAGRMPTGSPARWLTFVAGSVVALVAFFAVQNFAGCWLLPSLRAKFERRAREQGFDPTSTGALFAGLSPGDSPRIFESSMSWDAGFLVLTRDKLVYWGEQAYFALTRDQVDSICPSPDVPSWVTTPRPAVVWRGSPGDACQTFILQPIQIGSLFDRRAKIRRLTELLCRWKRGELPAAALPPACADLALPQFGEVTGLPPEQFSRLSFAVRCIAPLIFFSLCLSLALSLPFGIEQYLDARYEGEAFSMALIYRIDLCAWYALLASVLLGLFALWPFFRYRRATHKATPLGAAEPGAQP